MLTVVSLPSFESQPVTNSAHVDKAGVIHQCCGHSVRSHRGVGWRVGEAVMMGIMVDKGQNCPTPTSPLCSAGQVSGAWSLPNTVGSTASTHSGVLFAVCRQPLLASLRIKIHSFSPSGFGLGARLSACKLKGHRFESRLQLDPQ